MSITDAERAFYQQVLADPDGASVSDLRYAFFLAGADGGIPVVDPADLSNGDVPVWNATDSKWESGAGGGGEPDWAGLDTVGVGRAVFIENGGTIPGGTPAYTIVIEESA